MFSKKSLVMAGLMAVMTLPVLPQMAEAGPLSSACMRSDRDAKSRQLCRCIQKVANSELSRNEQRLAATFFKDPQKAQDIRQSDRRSHEIFWDRYKSFGQTVAAVCNRNT